MFNPPPEIALELRSSRWDIYSDRSLTPQQAEGDALAPGFFAAIPLRAEGRRLLLMMIP
jgi:hypothetical protein